ncbi:glucuronate isomerase, partial [Escherichia coli]
EFSARGIMQQMNVRMVGTTDDPLDDLEYHKQISQDDSFDIEVAPSWRPDKVFKIELEGFVDYLSQLEQVADVTINSFNDLLTALTRRLDYFDSHGCRASDHGIETLRYAQVPDEKCLDKILSKRIKKQEITETEIAQFSTAVLVWLGRQYASRGWVMQLHIGAMRNNNTRMYSILGADSGFDSIGDNNIS